MTCRNTITWWSTGYRFIVIFFSTTFRWRCKLNSFVRYKRKQKLICYICIFNIGYVNYSISLFPQLFLDSHFGCPLRILFFFLVQWRPKARQKSSNSFIKLCIPTIFTHFLVLSSNFNRKLSTKPWWKSQN